MWSFSKDPRLSVQAPNDPESERAWKAFPDPVANDHGFTWEYLATELIDERWVHIFVHDLHPADNRRTYARVKARPGWARLNTRLERSRFSSGEDTIKS
jgi:hypothetical protein